MQDTKEIRRKLCQAHFDEKCGHLGSNLSMVEIVLAIKKLMKPGDKFILSKQHCYRCIDIIGAPDGYVREFHNLQNLGNGVGIGVGMAIANPSNTVFVLCGDGETGEGSFWEGVNYCKEHRVPNLKIIIDCNGFSAYAGKKQTDMNLSVDEIKRMIEKKSGFFTIPTIKGKGVKCLENTLESHYKVLTQSELDKALEDLSCIKIS